MSRILVKYGDERLTISAAAARVGITPTAMRYRLEHGWPKEKLFSTERHQRASKVSLLKPEPIRPLAVLKEILHEHGSPWGAAIDGGITAEEFLSLENADE